MIAMQMATPLAFCAKAPKIWSRTRFLRPHLRNAQRTHDLERFVGAFDNKHTLAIEPRLRQLKAPTLIVWATDDVYFPVKWGLRLFRNAS